MRRILPLLFVLASALALRAANETAPVGPLAQDAFVSAVTRELSTHFNLEGELQVELLRAWNPPQMVAHDWQVTVTEYPAVAASAMLLRYRIVADGQVAAESTLPLRASLWCDVWIARQPLTYGATFDPAMLDTRRADLFRDRDALPAAVGDQGFIFARAVNPGRVVTW
ncbi:MAG TPA: hypothetical protein VHN79_03745, partial [Lacunisphaera sp.]|nr:hypothetical protein [Lacunisphaera sp.]